MNGKDSPKDSKDSVPDRRRGPKNPALNPRTLGPISDLERHLPPDWWRTLFNSLYLKTDGDVVENPENTRQEVDLVIRLLELEHNDHILDLCCGQGRHALELASRGFNRVMGCDRSRYLIRQARKRARAENLSVSFHEGDARKFRPKGKEFHAVLLMGNSFGYFEQQADDLAVLKNIARLMAPRGMLFLDVVDGEWMSRHFEPRSWEWIDDQHFVCRERVLAKDSRRIVTREVITHAEKGVIADQFYAERLYTKEELTTLFEEAGYQSIRFHGPIETASTRGQDLGMMGHRLIVTVEAPKRPVTVLPDKSVKARITVVQGDPGLPDQVKLGGKFNAEDMDTIRRMKEALTELPEFEFSFLDNHQNLIRTLMANPPEMVFNLCDEGFQNDPFKELHVPAILDMLGIPYTGAGAACLGLCYNKALVNAIAQSLDIPVPMESYIGPDDTLATLPSTFPALLKPNYGDSSMGITKDAVVRNAEELVSYIEWLRANFGSCSILVQEFLSGPEYTIGIIGNPGLTYRILPPLQVDYSRLDPDLPPILGYESKWCADSPYWTQVTYHRAHLEGEKRRQLKDYSNLLFERLGCRDYARFDFREDAQGNIKLLEANPNPGWCWDGKFNIMAGFDGLRYSDLMRLILEAAQERTALTEGTSPSAASQSAPATTPDLKNEAAAG